MEDTNNTPITPASYTDSLVQLANDKAIIAEGPLSLQYCKALNEIYKKETDEETGIVLETQANDEIVSNSIWIAAANVRSQIYEQGQDVGMLYGVKQDQVGISDVVNVADTIGQMTDNEKENSAIIIDAKCDENNDGLVPEVHSAYIATINEIAQENNVAVYPSLEAYVAALEGHRAKDGSYSGFQTGNVVHFKANGKEHRHRAKVAIKGKHVKVSVTVKHGHVIKPA
jgi:hypothetical protein